MANNYSASSNFLDQFKDQLTGDGEQKQDSNQGNTDASQPQGEWTQEQIQQYYQQYGYYDYNQYGGYPEGQQQPPENADPAVAAAYDYAAYQAYATSAYAGYYGSLGSQTSLADYYGRDYGKDRGNGPGQEPSRSVWLGNIHPDTTEQELHAAFAPYGMIEHVKILPAKNCAFVRFIELDAAIRAHSGMFGATIHSQQIKIGWGKAAEPMQKEDTGPPPCRNLWLGNINEYITEDQIRNAFGQFGAIEKVRILPQKNCAFVNFATLDAAIQAKSQMQGATLGDRPVKINFGKETATPGKEGGIGDLTQLPEPEKPRPPPPPPEGPPPDDAADKAIIDKLAEFVSRNGLKFEQMMQEKQKDNPKFKFIEEDHPHNPYYRFKIWCYRYPDVDPKSYEKPEEEKPAAPYGAVPPPPVLVSAPPRPPMPPGSDEDLYEFSHLLDTLVPTKDSIKATKTWIMERPGRARDIADFVRGRIGKLTDFEKKLNIIYLLHDVLHHSSRERAKTDTKDAFSEAFKPFLGDILQMGARGEHPDNQEKILKVVKIWEERKIYEPELIRQFEQGMQIQERVEEPSSQRGRSSSSDGSSRHRHRSRSRDRDDRDRKRRDREGRDRERGDDRYESKHRRH